MKSSLAWLVLALAITSLSIGFVHGSGARAAADDFAPQTVQTIDLATNPADVQILGTENAHLGGNGTPGTSSTFPRARAVAAGDLNNDGIADLLVGAPDATFTPLVGDPRPNSGAVYIVFGKEDFSPPSTIDTLPTATDQPDVRIFGAASGDNLGFAVAAGDVNGDGIDDIIAGAPGFNFTPPAGPAREDAGAVFVIFGANGFGTGTLDLGAPNIADDLIIGEQAGDLLGSALSTGDAHGGGSGPDLLVGAPGSEGPDPVGAARANGGAAYLLTGGELFANASPATKVIDLATGPASVKVFGAADSQLGSAVALGDVNGDNTGDLIVAAPKADRPLPTEANETGGLFVVFGGANLNPTPPATSKTFDVNSTQQSVSVYGETAGDHLGASVAVGDVNNDGAPDILVGAPEASGLADSRPQCGEAYLIFGGDSLNPTAPATELRIDVSLDTVELTVVGAVGGDHLGTSIAVGAVNTNANSDTIPDVLIGTPGAHGAKGAVNVLFGGSGLTQFPGRDMLLGQDDLHIAGQAAGDELGWAIATADFDNNTGGDIALGAPFAEVEVAPAPVRPNGGKVYVLLADEDDLPPHNENPTITVTEPNGGETVAGGAPFEIEWTAADPDGNETIQSFEIRLSTDGGANFNTIIASGVPGTADSFTWNVPTGLNAANARVQVTVTDNEGGSAQDASDANFSIVDAGVAVELTAPNGGQSLKWDQSFTITWQIGAGQGPNVRGFDLFFTTNNGTSFTAITPPNPSQPALPANAVEFQWTVPRICSSTVKVLVRATSITGAQSSDLSTSNFSISEREPQIDTSRMNIKGKKEINFRVLNGTTPLFVNGARIEISTDQTGTTFSPVDTTKVKAGGERLIGKGKVNGVKIGDFFPSGASRVIRITNATCAVTVLAVTRQGDSLIVTAP